MGPCGLLALPDQVLEAILLSSYFSRWSSGEYAGYACEPETALCRALDVSDLLRLELCCKRLREVSLASQATWARLQDGLRVTLGSRDGLLSFAAWLRRRRDTITQLELHFDGLEAAYGGLVATHLPFLLGALAGGPLASLSIWSDHGQLVLDSWLACLPSLRSLAAQSHSLVCAPGFQHASSLTRLSLTGNWEGAYLQQPFITPRHLPPGIRELRLNTVDARVVPDALRSLTGLENLSIRRGINYSRCDGRVEGQMQFSGISALTRLTHLQLDSCDLGSSASFGELAALTSLRSLEICCDGYDGRLKASVLTPLRALTGLTRLTLHNCVVTDGGVPPGMFSLPALKAACLDYLPVDDEFLEPEGELPSLGLLPPLCPGLESLEVHSSRAVLSLDSFAGLTALTELSLLGSRCYPVDPTSLCLLLQAVGRLPQLAKLRGVAHLHEAAAASREGRAAFEALLHSRPQLVLKCFGWHGN